MQKHSQCQGYPLRFVLVPGIEKCRGSPEIANLALEVIVNCRMFTERLFSATAKPVVHEFLPKIGAD